MLLLEKDFKDIPNDNMCGMLMFNTKKVNELITMLKDGNIFKEEDFKSISFSNTSCFCHIIPHAKITLKNRKTIKVYVFTSNKDFKIVDGLDTTDLANLNFPSKIFNVLFQKSENFERLYCVYEKCYENYSIY